MDSDFLIQALIYLTAAVISVPIATRLGLGSVLGYLIAGVVIGPFALNLVGDQHEVMHFAEFGVVIMLFLIGLELRPALLWKLRHSIVGLGGLQMLLTALVIGGILYLLASPWQYSLAVGLTLALSSTALVLQSLNEKGLLKTAAGQSAFSVLLFQDIAIIPIMALFPLLAIHDISTATAEHASVIENFSLWLQITIIFVAIALIILLGHYVATPVFRFIAESHLREIFTAFALLLVVSIAILMTMLGLSPALGAFVAGVVLAENEFRHELETNIEPFKGLLLGLFFIAVGAVIDFDLILQNPMLIISAVVGLIIIKVGVLSLLVHLFNFPSGQGLLFSLALAQGGEFAFVLGALGLQSGVFTDQQTSLLIVIVALSMLATPLLLLAHEWWLSRKPEINDKEADEIEPSQHVIIAGYGRFGQIVGRLLSAQGYELTILDHSPSQIDLLRRFGNKVFYGDASRQDLLHAAGADEAKLLVIAVDEPDKTLEIIEVAKKHFPQLKILARTIDRRHSYEIMKLNIDGFRRETFDSALNIGVDALKLLGLNETSATRAGELFAEYDEETLEKLSAIWGDDQSYGIASKQRIADLKEVLKNDQVINPTTASDTAESS